MKKISIIIPTYKPGPYIQTALNCLLQNQKLNINLFEVLIVLNGEKEPYLSDLTKICESYDNVVLIYSAEKGVSNARNIGLDVCIGEYVVFMDDDDEVSDHYLSGLLEIAKNNKATDIIQSNFKVKSNGIIENDYISNAYLRIQKNNTKFSLFSYRNFLSSVTGKLFNRSVIAEERFDPNFRISEDSIFLFQISKNIRSISFTDPRSIYFRVVREGSALRTKRSIHEIITNYFKKISKYSSLFFSSPKKYNLKLYLSRLGAVSKILLFELYRNSK